MSLTEKEIHKRIQQAADEKATELDLSKAGLTEIPPDVFKLSHLQRLNLSGNQFTQIPKQLANLTNLQKLNLTSNQLAEIPKEIALLTNLQELYFQKNQLTEIPKEVALLTNLQSFSLSDNQFTEIPKVVALLTNLQWLFIHHNRLTQIPKDLALPTNLQFLSLSDNQLTQISKELADLTDLQRLRLSGNQLTQIPKEIANLINLEELTLSGNQLTEIPNELAQLTKLQVLSLADNQLTEIPTELAQLRDLRQLDLYGNPLTSPPQEIIAQGAKAVLAFLRERSEKGRRQWKSKMLVVGEGGVGKTSLVRALRGEEFMQGLETTHGVQLDTLELEHPIESNVTMDLNCWDFGGQQIYHATHQFFLTNRSLFVLVWDARQGYEQGKLHNWLDVIKSRAPDSPILIVSAWTDERDADLPIAGFMKEYPKIVGHCEVSNKDGVGIEEVREAITDIAKDLPLMGEEWPADWLDAAEALREMDEKHISPTRMQKIMEDHGVTGGDREILGRWLHELGDILYFQDDSQLDDIVILKPQWVTDYISKVLESKQVIAREGIFTSEHMRELWSNITGDMQDHFLRLMEQFDLSYRTLEDREISLVVERLSLDPPSDYEQKWDAIKDAMPCREVSIKFALNTIPAGIPTWFIARSHRFTTHTHWRTGAVFADAKEPRHLALVQADSHNEYIRLSVRGPTPYNFLALLRDGLELTLDRFPGLEILRTIPCPGHDGKACKHEFDYEDLENAIEMEPPVEHLQCPKSFKLVPVSQLLFGLHLRSQDQILKRIEELIIEISKKQDHTRAQLSQALTELKELRELTQREFLAVFRREQSKIESHCPNVFVFRPRETAGWKKSIIGQKIELQIYCQAPGEWHPATDGGLYEIDDPAAWIKKTAPLLSQVVKVLKYAAPLAGPAAAYLAPGIEKVISSDIKLMTELVKKLPDLKKDHSLGLSEDIGEFHDHERATGAALRAVRALLDEKDPDHHWGGLKKILTPEGHYLWLCDEHAKEYMV